MKVAFLNDRIYDYASSDASAVGGNERQQWLLARALASSGWTVCIGIRNRLQAGERRTIEGVEFHGIMQGHYLLDWYRFLSSTRPDWLYWRGASHLLGPLVQIAHLLGVQTIFAAAFDTDVHPRSALTARQRWWPLYAWGLSKTERLFVQHGGQLEELPSRWRPKALVVRSIADTHVGSKPHSCREPYVAWVGMLRQPKRPDLLVEIAERSPSGEVRGLWRSHHPPVTIGIQSATHRAIPWTAEHRISRPGGAGGSGTSHCRSGGTALHL